MAEGDRETGGGEAAEAVSRGEASVWGRAKLVLALTALFALAIGWFQSRSPFFDSVDYGVTDLTVALLGDRNAQGHDKVALALIREETLVDAPAYSPIDRRVLAATVRELDQLGARAIGLDFVFDKPTDAAADQALIDAIRSAETPIVLGRFQDRDGDMTIAPQREFQDWFLTEATRPATPDGESRVVVGYLNTVTEIDGVVRRFPEPDEDAAEVPSFAEALARAAGAEGASGDGRISWLRAPVDGSDTFPRLFVEEDFVETSASPAPPTPFLVLPVVEDRVVIIGAALRIMADYHATPLNVGFGDESIGVEVQAQMTAQLLDGRNVFELGPYWSFALTVAAFALGMTLTFISDKRWLAEIGVVVVLYLVFYVVVFAMTRMFLPLVAPAVAWALATILAKLIVMGEEAAIARRARRGAGRWSAAGRGAGGRRAEPREGCRAGPGGGARRGPDRA